MLLNINRMCAGFPSFHSQVRSACAALITAAIITHILLLNSHLLPGPQPTLLKPVLENTEFAQGSRVNLN